MSKKKKLLNWKGEELVGSNYPGIWDDAAGFVMFQKLLKISHLKIKTNYL